MSLAAARLALRLGRFEMTAFGVLLVASIVGGLMAAAHIASLAPPAVCFGPSIDVQPAICDNAGQFYGAVGTFSGPLTTALIYLALTAGAFMGVPIVARELERGTSRLAWSLAPSRWRWYLARMLPMLVVVAILGYLAGYTADRLLAAAEPNLDVTAAFASFGSRGLLLASRAVFVFSIAVAVGGIVGRSLPAIIITAVVVAVGIGGGSEVHHRILAAEAVPVTLEAVRPGDLWIDTRFLLPDGSLVGWDYFTDSSAHDELGNPLYPEFALVVPGERYRSAETREALVLAGGSAMSLLLAGFVVTRRRPG